MGTDIQDIKEELKSIKETLNSIKERLPDPDCYLNEEDKLALATLDRKTTISLKDMKRELGL